MTTKYITLNIWNTENIKVKVNQGEVNARFLEVQFIDKNQPLNLEDKRVFFFAKKPDGNLIFNSCEIVDENDGTVNLALTSQMSIVDGIMQDCEFDIIATDLARLKVKGLILEIEKCTDFDSATESTSEFTALEEAIAGYEGASDAIDAHVANKNNPHEVTTTQIGAAETIHTHSTSDIMSGTLSIARGGTSAATSNGALSNLGGVPKTRTINSKPLSSDITLDASDVGAAESNHTHSQYLTAETDPTVPSWAKASTKPTYSYSEISNTPTIPTALTDLTGTLPISKGGTNATSAGAALSNLGAVPTTRTINSKALSSNITLNASDVGAAPYEVKYEEDFNNMKTPGLYTMVKCANSPPGGISYSLLVNKSYDEGDFVQQIAIEESTYDVYMRYCSNTSWSDWKLFSMGGHSHAAGDITSGILPITRGGTGSTTASGALANLGAAKSSHTHSISDITSGTLPISMGGTGATTASDALTNLGAVKFSKVVQQKVYITSQTQVNSKNFKYVSLTNPFRGHTTDKLLGITSFNIAGRTAPDATGSRFVMCLASGCPFDNDSALGIILVYNGHEQDLYITTDSYIVITYIEP